MMCLWISSWVWTHSNRKEFVLIHDWPIRGREGVCGNQSDGIEGVWQKRSHKSFLFICLTVGLYSGGRVIVSYNLCAVLICDSLLLWVLSVVCVSIVCTYVMCRVSTISDYLQLTSIISDCRFPPVSESCRPWPLAAPQSQCLRHWPQDEVMVTSVAGGGRCVWVSVQAAAGLLLLSVWTV